MTHREHFIAALQGRPPQGRVPHFELVFFLTMEKFGRVHPLHRDYSQWVQMSPGEQQLHLRDLAEVYIQTARHYEHSAIFMHGELREEEAQLQLIDEVRRQSGDDFFLMMHGDVTYAIPTGEDMMEFCSWLVEHVGEAKDKARKRVDEALARGERFKKHGGARRVRSVFGLLHGYRPVFQSGDVRQICHPLPG